MISGRATPEGTKRFASRFNVHQDFFRTVQNLTLSTLGLGTYLGEPDENDDQKMAVAIEMAVCGGVNVLDTAINYRAQRSERIIGTTVKKLIQEGKVQRDELFVSTKGGFIPFDGAYPPDPQIYFRDRFIKTKILTSEDVIAGCHSLAPSFIDDQFESSRKNLDMETIDLYFIHNPETQLEEITANAFVHSLHRAFVVLENKIKQKRIQFYGVATWNGFRVGHPSNELLKLREIMDIAADHGNSAGFRFVQLPVNLAMPEALTVKNQDGKSFLAAAKECHINVMASASIMQGRILGRMPLEMDFLAPGQPDAVKALNFVRSVPGVDIGLCGMKGLGHVTENLKLAQIPRVSDKEIVRVFNEKPAQ